MLLQIKRPGKELDMYIKEKRCTPLSGGGAVLCDVLPSRLSDLHDDYLSVCPSVSFFMCWSFSVHTTSLPSLPQIYSLTISALVWNDDLCGLCHLGILTL